MQSFHDLEKKSRYSSGFLKSDVQATMHRCHNLLHAVKNDVTSLVYYLTVCKGCDVCASYRDFGFKKPRTILLNANKKERQN